MTKHLTSAECSQAAQDLQEIYEQMEDLLEQATQIVRPTGERARAEAYCLGQIKAALNGNSMCTLQQVITALDEAGNCPDDEEEEETTPENAA